MGLGCAPEKVKGLGQKGLTGKEASTLGITPASRIVFVQSRNHPTETFYQGSSGVPRQLAVFVRESICPRLKQLP